MTYLLSGKLRGQLAADLHEPLANVAVRFYTASTGAATTEASGRPALDMEAVRAKESRWIGQVRADDRGEFSVDLARRTVLGLDRSPVYEGGALEIDLHLRYGDRAAGAPAKELQFTAAVVEPDWRRGDEIFTAALEICVPHERWSQVRTALDRWAISGQVLSRRTATPLVGARVLALDADLLGEDALGSGVVDAEGRFRIEFSSAAFRDARFGIDFEKSGPDLFFRVEGPDGRLIFDEGRDRAKEPDRRNVLNLYSTQLLVDG